jgi:hypothetical protein
MIGEGGSGAVVPLAGTDLEWLDCPKPQSTVPFIKFGLVVAGNK